MIHWYTVSKHHPLTKEARTMPASSSKLTAPLIVRVSPETYSAMQLAQPFAQRRSMQDLLSAIIDDFLSNLLANDAVFEKALVGLRESEAQRTDVLCRRTTEGDGSAS
jgi:hypothetical protein